MSSARGSGGRGGGSCPSEPPRGQATMLGVQHKTEESAEMYGKIQEINGHTFEVPPVNRYHSKTAENKFVSIVGGLDPIRFQSERFDNLRERLQVADKREKDACLQAIAVLYSEFLCKAFIASKGCDLAEMERMFYPTYLPDHASALRAVGLKRQLYYRRCVFSTLENLSRLPLEGCDDTRQVTMSFAEFYNLLWNFYTPFNPNAYFNLITAQSLIPNRELIEGTADYLAWRLAQLEPAAQKNPIVFIGSRIGKLGHLLNETKRIPVPIVHVHENPNTNPYLLLIPPEKQAAFKPNPILKMKTQAALEKYQPSIVLASDFSMHSDETALIRAQGCVREYVYFGMANSYAEGNGWDTWGYPKYRPKGEGSLPPFVQDGWVKVPLDHLSRWVIHKYDSEMMMGIGSVTSFVRRPLKPSFSQVMRWRMMRFKPFF